MPIKQVSNTRNEIKSNIDVTSSDHLISFLEQEIDSPLLILSPDFENFKINDFAILGVNKALLTHIPFSKKQLINNLFIKLFTLNDDWRDFLQKAYLSNEERTYKNFFPLFKLNVETHVSPINGLLVLIFKKIIENKKVETTEENLFDPNIYKSLFEKTGTANIYIDIKGNIRLVNHLACKLIKRPFEDIIDKTIWDTFPKKWAEDIFSCMQQVILNRKEMSFESETKDDNSQKKWFEITCRPIFYGESEISGVQLNIIELDQNKNTPNYKWQNTLFETVFNTIKDAILITDVQHNILICNKSVQEAFGYAPEELMGNNMSVIYADEKDYIQQLSENSVIENKTIHFVHVTKFKSKSGKIFTGEITETKLFDNDNWIGTFSIIQDITEKENLVQELLNSKNKAEESDRLKTAFLDNMSHEIRTPLNGILGFSKLLTNDKLEAERRKFYVDTIQKSGQQLLNIVTDIIDISKIETKQLEIINEKFHLNDFLDEIFDEFLPLSSQKKINLIFENISDENIGLFSDKEKIRRVLINLLSNAIKFTSKGSVSFGYTIKEKELTFFVKDTGIGFSDEFKTKIFDRFMQADMTETRSYGGNGLGLAICKGFVEALGGKIWVTSKKGKGSKFYFTLPAKELKKTSAEAKESVKVLVAEDEHLNYLLLEEILVQEGFTIIYAQNGKEAVEMYQANSDINIIIMDIRMPQMDGYEAMHRIRKINPKIPIIALTAFAMAGDREKVLKAGFNEYLSKPFVVNELLKKINSHL